MLYMFGGIEFCSLFRTWNSIKFLKKLMMYNSPYMVLSPILLIIHFIFLFLFLFTHIAADDLNMHDTFSKNTYLYIQFILEFFSCGHPWSPTLNVSLTIQNKTHVHFYCGLFPTESFLIIYRRKKFTVRVDLKLYGMFNK